MVAAPNDVSVSVSRTCAGWGEGLGDADVVGEEVRQVCVEAVLKVRCAEHRAQTRRCRCGTAATALSVSVAQRQADRVCGHGRGFFSLCLTDGEAGGATSAVTLEIDGSAKDR